jgi:hypothetical protein
MTKVDKMHIIIKNNRQNTQLTFNCILILIKTHHLHHKQSRLRATNFSPTEQ